VLSFRGVSILEFSKRCGQTSLLAAIQFHGWLNAIEDPLGPPSPCDAKNRLSNIVYKLNLALIEGSKSQPRRIHFSCAGRTVRWEIVGNERSKCSGDFDHANRVPKAVFAANRDH
jgi:hypothetical protein